MPCNIPFAGCTENPLHVSSWVLWVESKGHRCYSECLLLVTQTCLILAQMLQISPVSFVGLVTLGYMNILKLKLAVFIRLLREESN